MSNQAKFEDLLGKTLTSIVTSTANDEIRFVADDGAVYLMHHEQDCCENVTVESIVGELQDLLNSPILRAEVAVSDERPADVPAPKWEVESETWTFYKLATIRGYVDIRWHGSSNGYYGEGVDFKLLSKSEGA